ncbi:SEC7-like protein, partial [Fragilariopsis cylindrus CCMP1102]
MDIETYSVNNGVIIEEPKNTSPSIEAACNLVQRLLVQLTDTDSPPSNSGNNNDYNNTKEASKNSRQPPSPTQTSSDIERTTTQTSSIKSSSSHKDESHAGASETKNNLNVAFNISREKGLIKAIDYLIACNVLTVSPRDISSFLRIHCEDLNPSDLGSYLGEGGSDPSETEFWNLIRFNYIRAISFVGMTVEEGLRHLLTQGGFRLPGEAQQIDRLISTFARCYWEDNAGDLINCPIKDEDTIFVLSFAIIMLNTDLHKSHHVTKGKKKGQIKKMSRDEFIANLRGVNKGNEIDREYLSNIYDGIEANAIVL